MSELTKTVKYELFGLLESLKKYDTWIALCIVFALILFLYKEYVIAIILLLIVLVLNAARNHATGKVTAWERRNLKGQFKDEPQI